MLRAARAARVLLPFPLPRAVTLAVVPERAEAALSGILTVRSFRGGVAAVAAAAAIAE
jgi:hypothetical protein